MGAKLKTLGLVGIGALAGTLTTLQFSASAGNALAPLPHEELQQLAYAFNIIKSGYVDKVDERKLITDAIGGMVSGLDPHSQFFDRKALKDFREGTSGKFSGIGIEIGSEDGLVKVVSPIEGSPAFRAGLKSGDMITKIDDTAVRGLTLDQAVKRMRGDEGTKVELQIFRRAENRTFSVTLVREEIRVQSVRARMIEPGYGWIRVSQFQERTVADFAAKLKELYKQDPNLKGLVLDLRNDPGGYLEGAVAISAAFLPKDALVVSTKGQLPQMQEVRKANRAGYLRDPRDTDPLADLPAAIKKVPLIVLVNEGSASASEIVAGALQDHQRAVLMGSQTFGKGSVQTFRELGPDTGLKITTARYYTPKDRSIQAQGIEPDVYLDDTAEGDVYGALRTREADLDKHLTGVNEEERKAREKAREEARRKLEEELRNKTFKPLPEFGSDEDFQLRQALNRLQGKAVKVSATLKARPLETAGADGDEDKPRK